MLAMLRRLSIFLLLCSALIAAEPLLHSHPLQQNAVPGACAVCATGVVRIARATPQVSAPRLVVYTLTAFSATVPPVTLALTLPSRAPPIA
jgi:hypothetical protein